MPTLLRFFRTCLTSNSSYLQEPFADTETSRRCRTPLYTARPHPRRLAREISLERRRLSEKQRTLITRPDRNRPDEALSIPLFGRPLTLGGRYTSRIDYQNNRLLDSDLDDQLRIDQILELDLFYPITENISVYLSGRIAWRGLVLDVHEEEENEWQFSRDESWIYLGNLLATPFSFQVGRQRFSDDREWWWDADLDSGRLHFDLQSP